MIAARLLLSPVTPRDSRVNRPTRILSSAALPPGPPNCSPYWESGLTALIESVRRKPCGRPANSKMTGTVGLPPAFPSPEIASNFCDRCDKQVIEPWDDQHQIHDGVLFRCTQQFTLKRESEKRLDGQVTGSTSWRAHDGKARSVFCSGCTSENLSSPCFEPNE
jgi:hypothetical protein